MIPGVRFRATRRRPSGLITFDNSTVLDGSATTSFGLTVGGSNATIIVFAAGNLTNAATVDGVAMTLIGKSSNAAMWAITGLAAGARNVVVTRAAATSYIVSAMSYLGAASFAGGVVNSGTGTAMSSAPTGGQLKVAGFDFSSSSADFAGITTDGTQRVKYRRVNGNNVLVADKPTGPIGATLVGSSSWTSIGVSLAA
ncbi:minor tail protein [Gordonia phage Gaea]|uniref:Minor tail protein n=1 Tax=Gordonia phage Gaea TaxID=2483669 RepID=A0A3G3M9X5_9CAUD|nr:minor tail protein [Gordonia phage Gaea]AYR02848.1 hypothetical protein SEA_GAEA_40 [Gordonia phage Gaea]WMI33050.1 hypothetical protein SEA_SCHOTTB_39 [Gordonia Phage SchottB]